jgi:hypothetical protein
MSLNFLPKIFPRSDAERQADYERSLIRREAEVGGRLFGEVPKGHHRQFFCLDEHTWVWHEEWRNKAGENKSLTTHYYVRPTGIIKSHGNDKSYKKLSPSETRNLCKAAQIYLKRAEANYQKLLQPA